MIASLAGAVYNAPQCRVAFRSPPPFVFVFDFRQIFLSAELQFLVAYFITQKFADSSTQILACKIVQHYASFISKHVAQEIQICVHFALCNLTCTGHPGLLPKHYSTSISVGQVWMSTVSVGQSGGFKRFLGKLIIG